MKKFLFSAMLLSTAGFLTAAPNFTDKFANGDLGEWHSVQQVGNAGLNMDSAQGKFTFNGFKSPNPKTHPVLVLERKVDECKGDFAASMDLAHITGNNAFMGEVVLQLVGADGTLVAEAGLVDNWVAARGVMIAHVESVRAKKTPSVSMLPYDGQSVFTIERLNGNYIFSLNGKKKLDVAGEAKTVTAVRLRIKQVSYSGNPAQNIPAAVFGTFTVNSISFEAHNRSGEFSEKPVSKFDPAWRTVTALGAEALKMESTSDGLKISGFVNENKARLRATTFVLERKLEAVKGDFTAVLDMIWDQRDAAFFGEVTLRVLDDKGNMLAEIGLRDDWIAYAGRGGYGINNQKVKPQVELPIKASGAFIIERRGDVYTLRLRDWKFFEGKGSTAPVAALQLVFSKTRYAGSDKLPASHFGDFIIRNISFAASTAPLAVKNNTTNKKWEMGEPIIWYWAGPDMSEEFAAELAAAGFNVAFGRNMFDLDIMHKYGIRGMLWMPMNPDTPERVAQLKLWLESVRNHPAMFGVSCGDEPGVGPRMDMAQKRVDFMIENAPELLHFNNMYPFGASNAQLGTPGAPVAAYQAYIEQYCKQLKPQLLSYDHYTFFRKGDRGTYFLNQSIARKAALALDIPSMNIVQGAAWAFHWRVPNPQEYRYLAYTSLAYGSQGLSCYVYSYKGHWGSMRDPVTGKTGPLYEEAKVLNREFVAIAKELRPLKSLHPYHTGEIPFGVETLPDDCEFQLEPKLKNFSQGLVEPTESKETADNVFAMRPPVSGWIVSTFGQNDRATHVLVVNLDYKQTAKSTLCAPGKLEKFDAVKRTWSKVNSNRAELVVAPGSGVLLRLEK